MLTKTTRSAIKALVHLALRGGDAPIPRQAIALELHLSSTYLAKITSILTKAGILQSRRGGGGGVCFVRPPARTTLLSIVEACQGATTAAHCGVSTSRRGVCAYHRAMDDVHHALTHTLSRWTLADLAGPISGGPRTAPSPSCVMTRVARIARRQ